MTDINDIPEADWVCYDAECNFCSRWAERLRTTLVRHGFKLVPLQAIEACARLNLPERDLLKEMRVLTRAGGVIGGADAVIYLARRIRWARGVCLVSRFPGMRPVMRAIYRFIAKRRHCTSQTCEIKRFHERAISKSGTLAAWAPLPILTASALIGGRHFPGWAYMWTIALAQFAGCKWLTFWPPFIESQRPRYRRAIAYLFAWPGMNAEKFLKTGEFIEKPGLREWIGAVANLAFGAALVWCLARMALPAGQLAAGWVGMIGLVFVLHFGLFRFLSLAWQTAGINVQSLMRNPVLSRSVAEFWGRRWNAGFHELANRFLFRALRRRIGAKAATMFVFFASGIVHELVISVPARGGYGLPTFYFLVQGACILFERTQFGRRCGLRRGWRGWLFTLLATAGPAFWLFHPPFVLNVLVPFLKTIRAI